MTTMDLDGTGAAPSALPRRAGPLRVLWRRFRRNKVGLVALVVFGAIVLAAILAPVVTRYDPTAIATRRRMQGPSWDHWLGTDELGRDLYARLVFAARTSLWSAAVAVAVGVGIGVPLGIISAYVRGWVDWTVSRAMEIVGTMPSLLLVIALIAALGPGMLRAMLAVGVVYSPRFYRVTRAAALSVCASTYVNASKAIGTPTPSVLLRHVIPNVRAPLIVQVSLTLGFAILFESTLSYLGLGAQPPAASWGVMLARGQGHIASAPWLTIFPGIAIVLTVLATNLVGDALHDAIGAKRGARD